MNTDLETRLTSMAGALHHAVPEPPPRRRPPGPGRAVAGAALVLLAAVGAFAAVRTDDVDVDTAQVANLRGLVAENLPEGLELSWAGQQSGHITADPDDAVAGAGDSVSDLQAGPVELHTYLYGNGTATSPFGSDDLVVNVWERAEELGAFDAPSAASELEGAVTSTVQGQDAVVCAVDKCVGTGDAVNSVHWVTAKGQEVVAASRSLDVEQLRQIADGLVVDGTSLALGALPPELAGKLVEVGSLADQVVAGARQVDAYWVGYADGTGDRAVDVTTAAGDVDDLMAAVWALGAGLESLEVRGHDAFVVEPSGGSASGALDLVWQESEGVVARVSSVGLSREQLVGFVEQLRWVAEGEWQQVEELAAAAQAALPTTLPSTPGSVDGDVSVDAGDSSVDADVQVGSDGVDVGVQVDTPVGQIEASVHADLGVDAILGPLTQGAAQLQATGQQVADELEEQTTNPSLPFP